MNMCSVFAGGDDRELFMVSFCFMAQFDLGIAPALVLGRYIGGLGPFRTGSADEPVNLDFCHRDSVF
jgi:hypothetical protein